MPTRNPNTPIEVNLQQHERVYMVAKRHWYVLVRNELLLGTVWLLCSFVFLSRLAAGQLDGLSITLFVIGSIFFLAMIYIYFDWRNDVLVITNLRVIFQDVELLIRVQRYELYNRDIQDVKMVTESVIARYFNYGQIDVQTASRLRNIQFKNVAQPGLVRDMILRNVDPLKEVHEIDRVQQLVKAKVLGIGTVPTPPPPTSLLPDEQLGRGFFWVIPPSPQRRGDSIVWRKHWLFLFVEIADPILLLLIIFVGWSLLVGEQLVVGSAANALLAILLISGFAWLVYEVEDWRNDEYIVTPANVIDIERKPLGQETKRETTWDRIEKVSLDQPNLLARILNYGNIELATAGQQENFTFRRVGQPEQVLAIISDYRDQFQQSVRDRDLDSTLTLLHHYHKLTNGPQPPLPPTQPMP